MAESARLVLDVLGASGLRAYCAAVDARVRSGRWREAMAMLVDSGADPETAWEIIAGWPRELAREEQALILYRSRVHKATVRFAHYVPSWRGKDWHSLLSRGLRAAAEHRPESSEVRGPEGSKKGA